MSTVLIIGASRGIGLETVKLALKAGHSARAMGRSANAIRLHDPRLEKLDGDALDQHTAPGAKQSRARASGEGRGTGVGWTIREIALCAQRGVKGRLDKSSR
jgi:NAD(P)-dependent dehydrogenase (short-subunit alcohol dehydrogenase family)